MPQRQAVRSDRRRETENGDCGEHLGVLRTILGDECGVKAQDRDGEHQAYRNRDIIRPVHPLILRIFLSARPFGFQPKGYSHRFRFTEAKAPATCAPNTVP